ncbi:MAG: sulfite exporter TauE/SafE family protein [Cyanobacteria bacterium P01_A01_bin.17]
MITALISTKVLLLLSGLAAGLLAGVLGIGGGVLLVPLLVGFGYPPVQAVGTSTLAILIIAFGGTLQNLRSGYLRLNSILALGLPSIVTAQLGAFCASQVWEPLLLVAFGLLLWVTIYLVDLRKKLARSPSGSKMHPTRNLLFARLTTGGLSGFLAGFFGVGGGVVLVPLQILLVGESMKVAIQTSLGVIMITALSALIGHAIANNVLLTEGLLVGIGGFLGAQISTRFLPKLPEQIVSRLFRSMLALLSVYVFWQAWQLMNAA